MVEELSKLHGHVAEALGGEGPRPTGAMEGVGDLPRARKGGAVSGCGHTVSVRGRGKSPHGDAGGSPAAVGQVVAATVQPPELVRGLAGGRVQVAVFFPISEVSESTVSLCGEDVLSMNTLGPQT